MNRLSPLLGRWTDDRLSKGIEEGARHAEEIILLLSMLTESHDGFYQRTADGLCCDYSRRTGSRVFRAAHGTKIPLPNVEGHIDHMSVDVKGQRLFIAALGNNSIEILDLIAGKHFKSIPGLHEPQGVSFIPAFNKLLIANGKTGACDILDGYSFERIKRVKFADDADNIRYLSNENLFSTLNRDFSGQCWVVGKRLLYSYSGRRFFWLFWFAGFAGFSAPLLARCFRDFL